jgi:hypothetical protein
MKLRAALHAFTALAAITFLAGCATFSDEELAQIRDQRVSPYVMHKLATGRILTPDDVIELTRHRVAVPLILRQIRDTGVDYVLKGDDVRRMERARVPGEIIDALIIESERHIRIAAGYYPAYYGYGYDPFFYGPYYPYYGGWSFGVGFSDFGGHHGHHRH